MALLALALCSVWVGWSPPLAAAGGVAICCLALARPRGQGWAPWLVVAAVLAVRVLVPAGPVEVASLEPRLEAHCRGQLHAAEAIATDGELLGLFAATGELLEPAMPFEELERFLDGVDQRSIYLADDRGRLVAWAGASRAYPESMRPLGPRSWGVEWSASGATLLVREPLLAEGRLVGAVTVADRSPLEARRIWGMSAPPGWLLRLGGTEPGAAFLDPEGAVLEPEGFAGVSVPVRCVASTAALHRATSWWPWLALAVLALVLAPAVAWAAVVVGGAAVLSAPGPAPEAALVVLVLAALASVARLVDQLPPALWHVLRGLTVAVAATVALLGERWELASWLPTHLLAPGWGGVWMVGLAWVLVGWPGRVAWRRNPPAGPGGGSGPRLQPDQPDQPDRQTLADRPAAIDPVEQPEALPGGSRQLDLSRRLVLATALAVGGMLLGLARLPVELARAGQDQGELRLPRGELSLASVLPVGLEQSVVDDLAPLLARRWRLDRWTTPSALVLVDADGRELSRWGDLEPAGGAVRMMREWRLTENNGWQLELWVSKPPWHWLRDWRPGEPDEQSWTGPVWFAALDRSGMVAATLHPQIRQLSAEEAGNLYYTGGGWTFMQVGGARRLARVRRRDDYLVAAVAHHPALATWAVQAALACVWALLGMTVARWPRFHLALPVTFGGRLRLLVAGGVVLPLVILTLFLHLRLRREEQRLEEVMGLDALRAARHTVLFLAGGLDINDDLARWLALQVGGEVAIFEGADVVGASRADLLAVGVLPQLPAAEAFPRYLLRRDDPAVLHQLGRLTAVGAVTMQGRWLLLQIFPADPLQSGEAPEAVDWLLTGAILAALVALVLTSRFELRLSASLRDLVAVARRLHRGEPVGEVRPPAERDLAEVLAAVRLMSEEVQQREQSLRYQEELLRVTLATLAPAVIVFEPDGTVRFANSSAERLLATHRDQVVPRVFELFEAGNDSAAGIPAVVETVQPVPGSELTWRLGVAAVPLPDGSRGLVAVVDDVTDVVRVDRLRQINQMARIVAHEVKNPLTPVRLWVQEIEEALRRQDPDLIELVAEACREIGVQVGRLQRTANSFSNLVALERWEPALVDLSELVDEVLRGLAVVERRGIHFIRKQPAEGGACVVGDRQWLRRAVSNLVKNSVEALGESPGEIRVALLLEAAEPEPGEPSREPAGLVVLEVEDTAGGVPADQLHDLFSPTFSTTTSGSGLGLALVQQVAAKCQGRAVAVNGEQGLQVRIELPRASATMSR